MPPLVVIVKAPFCERKTICTEVDEATREVQGAILSTCSNAGNSDVNDLCFRLFCARKGDLDSNQLPACMNTLRKH
ncbi:unnamed protein product [Porites lobata]|uniref:Uncharacterized protein n=1 Tax=Porites lobata TaxID=104759 RepID=A0ABN8PYQ7_9CNID|nr:unnamed protein product [Porites lobata]